MVYVDAVRAVCPPGCEILVEHRFHLKELHSDLFGTSDAIVWNPDTRTLHVFDLKYGAGVAVEVEENPQLMYYALGALLETKYPAKRISMTIVQPRCDHRDGPVRSKEIGVVDLVDWSADLMDAVEAVEQANSDFDRIGKTLPVVEWETDYLLQGDHCRFCLANSIDPATLDYRCPIKRGQRQEAAKMAFVPAAGYDPKALAELLPKLDVLEAYVKHVREFAYAEAEKGHDIPQWKLVEKRATRKWRDPDSVVGELMTLGLPEEDLVESKPKTPAAVEKLLSKEQRSILDDLCIKESSGHTLVPETDKRPAIKVDAKSAFSNS
jgi:hypothetical protein